MKRTTLALPKIPTSKTFLFACTVLWICIGTASMASAQDEMTFGEDEVEAPDDTDMTFTVDDVETDTTGPTITGVIIAAEGGADPAVVQGLTSNMMLQIDKMQEYQSVTNADLLAKFKEMGDQGALDCAYNPVCLSRVGNEIGVKKLVIGRLSGSDGNYDINLDLINVEDGSVEQYDSKNVQGGEDALQASVSESLPKLLGIRKLRRRRRRKKPTEQAELGTVQKTLAWGSVGLGVVSIGLGAYFGLNASSLQDELDSGERLGGANNPYKLTQQEAQSKLDEAQSSALLANVFYGVGLASGIASVLLFTIRPGEDIATEDELSGLQDFRITPSIQENGLGVQTGFSW